MTSAYNHRETNSISLQLRMPPSLIGRIDGWAGKEAIASRSEAVRTLIEAGLEAKEAEKQ